MDLDETQEATEPVDEKRKGDGVSREMMEGAAQKAVDDAMTRLESQQQRLIDRLDGSVEKAANTAAGSLTTELYDPMQKWESQMGAQMQTQMQNHWE